MKEVHVTLEDGTRRIIPEDEECLKYSPEGRSQPSPKKVVSGWLDNVGYYTNNPDKSVVVRNFTGYYQVPPTPLQTGNVLVSRNISSYIIRLFFKVIFDLSRV